MIGVSLYEYIVQGQQQPYRSLAFKSLEFAVAVMPSRGVGYRKTNVINSDLRKACGAAGTILILPLGCTQVVF